MTVDSVAAPVLSSAGAAIAAATELAGRFSSGAVERDRDRILPVDEIVALSRSGLLALTVPRERGGADVAPSVVAEVTRILATADPNIAQIPHSHFVYLNLVRLAGPEPLAGRIFDDVLAGGRIANAQSERGGMTVVDISTRLTPAAGEVGVFSLNGEKFYATGSLFADTLAVLARLDDEVEGYPAGEYVAFIAADARGVEIVDDWNGLGQRTTGSGTVQLRGVTVQADQLIARAGAVNAPTAYGAYAQLLHVAIDIGIARGALDAAVDFVRTKSRPWFEADVDRAVDDELLVQRFGELAVDVITAEATFASAGAAVDAAVTRTGDQAGEATVSETDSPIARASIAVAVAKVAADRVANSVTSALFEVSGTRSAAVDLGLDHFWRNARTHTLHDPVRWKYQHIGRYVLRGEAPPVHGVI